MEAIPVVNGIPVVPGTALAAVVAISPPELLPLMPVQILTALNTVPATALVAAVPGAAVPAVVSVDLYEKALQAISATAAAALSVGAVVKVK